ncbi:DUF805 domain-containing protein [Volucribacter amazonae]|uniref:DUF805 domain-containing protein n=1 Tax=Volucribacter amazonae TaxID=256731 RepID=A0A9X4PB94_9PAST|nr:DUF805 domain-containing protein [Volucribacter amazonae]MDG6895087.1 hypothetical protein [Volucribacter amazonae]
MNWYQALFLFKGRLNRQGFWQGIAVALVLLFALATLFPMQQLFQQSHTAFIPLLGLILVSWIILAVCAKRLHDRGRSAWALMMLFLPVLCYFSAPDSGLMAWALGRFMPIFITTLLLLDWGVFKGIDKANQYGEQGLSIRLKS